MLNSFFMDIFTVLNRTNKVKSFIHQRLLLVLRMTKIFQNTKLQMDRKG